MNPFGLSREVPCCGRDLPLLQKQRHPLCHVSQTNGLCSHRCANSRSIPNSSCLFSASPAAPQRHLRNKSRNSKSRGVCLFPWVFMNSVPWEGSPGLWTAAQTSASSGRSRTKGQEGIKQELVTQEDRRSGCVVLWVGSCQPLPSPCWNVVWMGLVWATTVAVSSWVQKPLSCPEDMTTSLSYSLSTPLSWMFPEPWGRGWDRHFSFSVKPWLATCSHVHLGNTNWIQWAMDEEEEEEEEEEMKLREGIGKWWWFNSGHGLNR